MTSFAAGIRLAAGRVEPGNSAGRVKRGLATRLKRERRMRRLISLVLLAGIAVSVAGCIVEPGRPGGGWCWWHPYRCR